MKSRLTATKLHDVAHELREIGFTFPMSFPDLGLSDELLRAVSDAGYQTPTPIQEKAIPYILMGRDILGCAQTGTGKTASFTLPMLDILQHGQAKSRMPRSLILEPTRELAAQVAENFENYGKYHRLSKALLIGGESMNEQIKVIDGGVDILIATPGRLLDLFGRGSLLLNDVRILVIDEADRMLDMGFIPDVENIVVKLPKIRTTLMFSATMPKEIRHLADQFLMNPKEISVAPPSSAAATIIQGLIQLPRKSAARDKREALRNIIIRDEAKNGIIFCNRKRDVSIVFRSMLKHGFEVGQLHGDMIQSLRMETLDNFRAGKIRYLVCSDVAARGLDIPAMTHVFNFDVPTHAEDYVHRIGRTGRAGREGYAYTIALPEDAKYVESIEKLTGKSIPLLIQKGGLQSASNKMSVIEEDPLLSDLGENEEDLSKDLENNIDKIEPNHGQNLGREHNQKVRGCSVEPISHNGVVKGLGGHVPAFLMQTFVSPSEGNGKSNKKLKERKVQKTFKSRKKSEMKKK